MTKHGIFRSLPTLCICALFIVEGILAGKVFDRHSVPAPLPSQLPVSARPSATDWPLSQLTAHVRSTILPGSPLQSALRIEANPDELGRRLHLFITGSPLTQKNLSAADSLSSDLPLKWNNEVNRCELSYISIPELNAPYEASTSSLQNDSTESRLLLLASKYRHSVSTWSRRFDLNPDLVYAIIAIESNFNPNLISPRGAHGLMQVVPATAGHEVSQYLGENNTPSSEELLDPDTNIKYGTGYFRLLLKLHFGAIKDERSREYCAIAGYNSGSSPVLRVFGNSRDEAFYTINNISSDEVLNRLLDRIPMRETRSYLRKILKTREYFDVLTDKPDNRHSAAHFFAERY